MNRRIQFLFGSLFFLLIVLAFYIFADRALAQFLYELDRVSPRFIDLFRAYTDAGKSVWYLVPTGFGTVFCLAICRFRAFRHWPARFGTLLGPKFFYIFCCVALSGIIADVIKPIVARARPIELKDGFYGFRFFFMDARWNSFPSGHATTAFALAVALWFTWPRYRALWLSLGCLLAISRVMVNAHYVSDVLMGSAIGALTSIVLHTQLERPRARAVISKAFNKRN